MEIPNDYRGREQSFLKHRVLSEYLIQWGIKIGSIARNKKPLTLWYVDCFAGPWRHRNEELRDTSIAIGLQALEDAAQTWASHGHHIQLGAIFVEKDSKAYSQLHEYLGKRRTSAEVVALQGTFDAQIPEIKKRIRDDPAFIFVDPTGFKGVAMSYIAELTKPRMRDVLINVMFNDINRFKDDERAFLRQQMCDFFGLSEGELPTGLREDQLLALYRENLKNKCQINYAADLAIPHPTHERTWFRLVIGGNHPRVLQVFRDVESKVIGREAASIRTVAKQREDEGRSGQLALGAVLSPSLDPWYKKQNEADREAALTALCTAVAEAGHYQFRDLWPSLLQKYHVTFAELRQLVREAVTDKRLIIKGAPLSPRPRLVQDDDWLSAPTAR